MNRRTLRLLVVRRFAEDTPHQVECLRSRKSIVLIPIYSLSHSAAACIPAIIENENIDRAAWDDGTVDRQSVTLAVAVRRDQPWPVSSHRIVTVSPARIATVAADVTERVASALHRRGSHSWYCWCGS
jgi:hypothetical protein